MKRKAFVTVSNNLPSAGAATPTGAFSNPENFWTLQPPANLVVTRITVQVQGVDYTSATYYEVVVNNVPPLTASDGLKIACTLDGRGVVQMPQQFTFETFDEDGGIETTMYIANTIADPVPVTVVFEGYYND